MREGCACIGKPLSRDQRAPVTPSFHAPASKTMDKVCINCGNGAAENDAINHVGMFSIAPILAVIEHASKLNMVELVQKLKEKKDKNLPIFLHVSCRTKLKNDCRNINTKPSNTSKVTRSGHNAFDFKVQCFFCTETIKVDNKNPGRKNYHIVSTLDSIQTKILSVCAGRDDEFSKSIERRLMSVSDLVAAEARYHGSCRRNFERFDPKPDNIDQNPYTHNDNKSEEAFDSMCKNLENNYQKYSIKDFSDGLASLNVECFSNKKIKSKLISRYGSSISFIEISGKSSVIVLDMVKHKLVEDWYKNKKLDRKEEENRIIEMAACIMKTHIRNHTDNTEMYPDVSDILNLSSDVIPEILMNFIGYFTNDLLKMNTIAQAIYACCKPHTVLPLQLALAVSVDNRYSSKWLVSTLSKCGFSSSYDEIVRYKQNIVSFENADDIIMHQNDIFLQYVGDNTDHNMDTIDGKNSHHGLGSIIIGNGTFGMEPLIRKAVPRLKKINWSAVKNNEGIPLLEYSTQGTISALKMTVFETLPSLEAFQPNHADILWVCSKLLKEDVPQWSGFMSTFHSDSNRSRSAVTMLPIIDLNATDPNSLFSLLSFIDNQCRRLGIPETTVTFDQPLYIKAYEIVESRSMKIFVRLGGFHQLMSYLGSIGYMMEGSGLREALQTVYAELTVGHMFSGKAYARALRGHLLCVLALLSLLLREYTQKLPSNEIEHLTNLSSLSGFESLNEDECLERVCEWYSQVRDNLKSQSRTASLWLSYMEYVLICLDFIRAERTSQWLLHIEVSKRMLNLFAATGHNNYAKACRLYVQNAMHLQDTFPYVYEQFRLGRHTVKRTEKGWCGIWTDLSIEQILMKSLKGRGGVIGRGISENVTRVWTMTMHRFAEIMEALESLTTKSEISSHKDILPSRVKRDNEDYRTILAFFEEHSPFDTSKELMSIHSGILDDTNKVNCDTAESIGAKIQARMEGKTYTSFSFRRTDKITNLLSLHSTVKINGDEVDINPTTLFLRLVSVIDRQPDTKSSTYFEYELATYPLSLFKDGEMRSPAKYKLKEYVLKNVPATNPAEEDVTHTIMDGGAFLWLVNWKKGDTFSDIGSRYVKKARELNVSVVVFDGYDTSTKNVTQSKRARMSSTILKMEDSTQCLADRSLFMGNYTNKANFIRFLSNKLTTAGIRTLQAPCDADTSIVEEAIRPDIGKESVDNVVVMSDDTDILCLLVHHCSNNPASVKIKLKNVTCQQNKHNDNEESHVPNERKQHDIQLILNEMDETSKGFILFAHAYCGSDTTSAIYNLGKLSILEKLKTSHELRTHAGVFYKPDASPEEVGKSSIEVMKILFSNRKTQENWSLAEIRRSKYDELVSSTKTILDPARLPPTERASHFHGLRVYHQIKVWITMSKVDLSPTNWGWEIKDGKLRPIKTDMPPAPESLLKIVRCACKKGCSTRCSCRRAGLNCATSCKECRGLCCKNSPVIDNEE